MVKRSAGPVKIQAGALDDGPHGSIVLRGVVAPETLANLLVDDYQREAAPVTSLGSILDALKEGEVLPDIELGMRGEQYRERDGTFTLQDSVYIIDGLQRVTAARHFLEENPKANLRIGATVHFGTQKKWERERFRILNTLRSKVSPNVILRNVRGDSPAMQMLYTLSHSDKSFPLYDRVSWNQRMTRGEILSALTMAKVAGWLHSHKAQAKRTNIGELVPALDRAMEIFGPQHMRNNMKTFFELIDECWGIRRIQYREGAPYIKATFLRVMGHLLADHHDFWRQPDEKQLFVEASLRRKLALFPMQDPQVVNLSGSSGKSSDILYILIRDHINRGKRGKRLRSRHGDMISVGAEEEDSTAS